MLHTFRIDIKPPIQNPDSVRLPLSRIEFSDYENLIKNEKVTAGQKIATFNNLDIVVPLAGEFISQVGNNSNVAHDATIGTLVVELELDDVENVFKAVVEMYGKTSIRSVRRGNFYEQEERPYCMVGLAPGYEHFELVLDTWSRFLQENHIPKEYHTYEYFKKMAVYIFNIRKELLKDGINVFNNLNAEPVKEGDFDIDSNRNQQLFSEKI